MLSFRPGIVDTCCESILLPSSSSSTARHVISHKHKKIEGSGGGKLNLCSDTPFILMRSKEGDDGMTNSGWRSLKGLTNVKKKHWRKSTSVLRLDWSSVLARVFFTQIASLFGKFFDFFCLHRIRVGQLFEAISVCVRIRVPLRYRDDHHCCNPTLLQSPPTLPSSSYSCGQANTLNL